MFRVTELSPAFGRDAARTAAGFETWKKQFAGEAQARVVTASTIAALMATTYSTATIAGQSEPLAIQKTAPSFSHSRFIEGTVRVLPSAAMQRPNLVAPLAHTTRALWRDRAERRSHGAAE
jgi:membrane-bound lytic murein transglycosylase B